MMYMRLATSVEKKSDFSLLNVCYTLPEGKHCERSHRSYGL